jgi:nitrate reductase NapE component
MAFCTNCGAEVTGAFCKQCGTPVSAASAAPAPVFTAQPAAVAAPVAGAAPVQRKTSPLVWVLVIILGLFVLGAIGVVGTGLFIVHKVRQAGFDPELMQRNPGLAISKMIATANPDVEVLNTDEGAGKITVRDKKTGKVVTMTFDDAKNGKFSFSAQGDDGKTASLEFGAGADKLPSWVPAYPGAKVEGTFAMKGDSGQGNGGSFGFSTSDAPDKVISFYQDKCKELGLNVKMTTHTNEGGMIVAADEGETRTLQAIVGSSSGQTKVQVIYGLKK